MQKAESSLPSAFRLLLSAFCLPPSAFRLLLSAFCLLARLQLARPRGCLQRETGRASRPSHPAATGRPRRGSGVPNAFGTPGVILSTGASPVAGACTCVGWSPGCKHVHAVPEVVPAGGGVAPRRSVLRSPRRRTSLVQPRISIRGFVGTAPDFNPGSRVANRTRSKVRTPGPPEAYEHEAAARSGVAPESAKVYPPNACTPYGVGGGLRTYSPGFRSGVQRSTR